MKKDKNHLAININEDVPVVNTRNRFSIRVRIEDTPIDFQKEQQRILEQYSIELSEKIANLRQNKE